MRAGHHVRHGGRARAARRADRGGGRGNRVAGGGDRACACGDRARPSRGDGQRRGRRARRAAARGARRRGRHRVLARLRRPAGADLRAGRLGAHLRLRGRGGRARAPSTCPPITSRRPTRSGALRLQRRAVRAEATSTRRCSTRSSTARSRRSRWPPSRTRPACARRPTGLAFPPAASTTCRAVLRPRGRGGVARAQPAGGGRLERAPRRHAGARRPALGHVRHLPGRRTSTSRNGFAEYGVVTDPSGRYAAIYRPTTSSASSSA